MWWTKPRKATDAENCSFESCLTLPDVMIRTEEDILNVTVATGSVELPEWSTPAISASQDAMTLYDFCTTWTFRNLGEERKCMFEESLEESVTFLPGMALTTFGLTLPRTLRQVASFEVESIPLQYKSMLWAYHKIPGLWNMHHSNICEQEIPIQRTRPETQGVL